MNRLLELLQGDLGKQIIAGISKDANQPADKTASVVQMAVLVLMGAMKRNASDPRGAAGLLTELEDKHDGSILNKLNSLFEDGVAQEHRKDGMGILVHVLGNSQDNVVNVLAQKSGLDNVSVARILQVLAPIVLGYLGREKRQHDVTNENGLDSLLGELMGGNRRNQSRQQALVESLLDGNNNESVLDDLGSMILGGGKKRGGFFGGLFSR